MSGKLYVVGTPIGNLGDFSPRAVETLAGVDFIAAEDTRVTLKLLNHFAIKKEMISYFEHNRRERGEFICSRILAGESCALVTDAGMPAISDPGEDLVKLCHDYSIKVEAVPGPTAFATAIAVSGMVSGRFTFEGFLSVNKKSRRNHLAEIADEKRTMIFYEAPHKLANTLSDLYKALGDREITIVRELTKIHEQIIKTTLEKAVQDYSDTGLKGELVLIIQGRQGDDKPEITFEEAVDTARSLIENGMSLNDAAKYVASQSPFRKGEIYKALI